MEVEGAAGIKLSSIAVDNRVRDNVRIIRVGGY